MPNPDYTTQRAVNELRFTTHDGTELVYRHWPAQQPSQGAIALFHRGHEHGGRMAHLVDELNLPEFDFFAWDARGNGLSPGPRGFSPSLACSVRDVQTFIEHLAQAHGIAEEKVAVIAQSVGAVLVSTWLHDYAPKVRCAVLASPAFQVKLYVPFARTGIRLMQKLRGLFYVNSYVKAKYLTHDPARIDSYNNDPLIARPIASNILLQLYQTAERVVADAAAIITPVQLLISGADWVVHHPPQHEFYVNLGSTIKERHVLPGFYHDTLGEKDRALALTEVRRFLLERFAEPLQPPDQKCQHLAGWSRRESDTLATPLPPISLKGLYWAGVRNSMKIGGALSAGIRLGHETGFDSGSTLDYVYRNQPTGCGPLGRLMDRSYLNSPGWTGIRQRKVHIEELLGIATIALRNAQQPVRVLDIAAGHGRYLLERIAAMAIKPDSVLLRDYSEINVRDGSALIKKLGLTDIARFIQADAFDPQSIAATTPKPTLGVVSGLYELFPDNALVERSLSGMAQAIEPGGYLIYTGQPWHPQLELIARALTSHRAGAAWVMRRRSQAEMDQLVAAAGFEKITQRIDGQGIFTVSLARRNA